MAENFVWRKKLASNFTEVYKCALKHQCSCRGDKWKTRFMWSLKFKLYTLLAALQVCCLGMYARAKVEPLWSSEHCIQPTQFACGYPDKSHSLLSEGHGLSLWCSGALQGLKRVACHTKYFTAIFIKAFCITGSRFCICAVLCQLHQLHAPLKRPWVTLTKTFPFNK